mgnify:CR=1 FL=1
MSRTKRKILNRGKDYSSNLFIDVVDDSATKHRKVRYLTDKKLKPYTKGFKLKEKADDNEFGSRFDTGRGAKLNRDRINRSYKKGFRQQLKKELIEELNSI